MGRRKNWSAEQIVNKLRRSRSRWHKAKALRWPASAVVGVEEIARHVSQEQRMGSSCSSTAKLPFRQAQG